eukprot:m.14658 g.14658  ORF g.14658 m.14658 type:complete len:51 (+) comp25882_c0_seq1:93-245(+)
MNENQMEDSDWFTAISDVNHDMNSQIQSQWQQFVASSSFSSLLALQKAFK